MTIYFTNCHIGCIVTIRNMGLVTVCAITNVDSPVLHSKNNEGTQGEVLCTEQAKACCQRFYLIPEAIRCYSVLRY